MDPIDVSHIVSSVELFRAQQLVALLSHPQPSLAFPEFNSRQKQTGKGSARNAPKRRDTAARVNTTVGGNDVFTRLLKDVEVALEMEYEELEMNRQKEIDHAATYQITAAVQESNNSNNNSNGNRASQSGGKRTRSDSSESSGSSSTSSQDSTSGSDDDQKKRGSHRSSSSMKANKNHKRTANCEDFLSSLSPADVEFIIARRLGNVALMQLKEFISKSSDTLNELTERISELAVDVVRSSRRQQASDAPYDVHVCFLSTNSEKSIDSVSYGVSCSGANEKSTTSSSVTVGIPSNDLFFCEIVVRDREELEMRNEKEAYDAYLQMAAAAEGQTVENTKTFWNSILTTTTTQSTVEDEEDSAPLEGSELSKLRSGGGTMKACVEDTEKVAFRVTVRDSAGGSGVGDAADESNETHAIIRGSRRVQSSQDLPSSAALPQDDGNHAHILRGGIVQPEMNASMSPDVPRSNNNAKAVGKLNGAKLPRSRNTVQSSEQSSDHAPNNVPPPPQSLFGLVCVFYLSHAGILYSAFLRPDIIPANERSTLSGVCLNNDALPPPSAQTGSDVSPTFKQEKKPDGKLQAAYPLKCANADSFVRNLLRL